MIRFENVTYALLRVIAGLMFSFHGMQKLFGIYGHQPPAGSQLWFGGIIELVGGILIAVGLFTRGAALLCSGQMAIAYAQFHWKLNMTSGGWIPTINKGELALLYCLVFLYVVAKGGGRYSLDGALKRWRDARRPPERRTVRSEATHSPR